MSKRIAVFVDGENISAERAAEIASIVAQFGQPKVLRVYGNAAVITKWSQCPGCSVIHSGVGKNATDILLTVDAMEFALARNFDMIAIASSDNDFNHLATRLKELGKQVLGIGEAKASALLRATFCEFHELKTPKKAPPSAPKQKPPLDQLLRTFIAQNGGSQKGALISTLGGAMHRIHGVKVSTLEEKTWRSYLVSRPALYDLDPKGPDARVRFKPNGFKNTA